MTKVNEMINKLNMELTRKDGEWAISVPSKSRPTASDITFIKNNKPEIIEELKAIKNRKLEAEKAKKEEKKNRDIEIDWHDGEYLSGYMTYQNGELLEELGLAEYVNSWGYKVKEEVIEALGKEFTAEQAREYAKPAIEKANQVKIEKENARKEKLNSTIETAKETGDKVEISRYTVNCNGSVDECDTDILVQYVDGEGNITEQRIHTH